LFVSRRSVPSHFMVGFWGHVRMRGSAGINQAVFSDPIKLLGMLCVGSFRRKVRRIGWSDGDCRGMVLKRRGKR
jgi:hypothetical protein